MIAHRPKFAVPRLAGWKSTALALAVLCWLARIGSAQPPANGSATSPAAAAEDIPPALTEYKGRTIAQTMHYTGAPWLVRESRQREEDCEQLLDALAVQPGQVICDMGCGNGFYTIPLAKLVGPEGRILAVDIQPEMLSMLNERTKAENLENVEPILGSVADPKLPEKTLDMVLCVDVYHEFSHPEQMLAAMRKGLKPDGRLVLVEFREEDPDVPIKPEHKMSKRQIKRELVPNGFKVVEEYDDLPWQHLMFFEPVAKRAKSRRAAAATAD